jgi:hypothetical protein
MTREDREHVPPEGDALPTAYAQNGTLHLRRPWSEAELQKGIDVFLSEITLSLKQQGCLLIGHIKGALEHGEKGHLFFSVTSFEQRARFKGGLTGRVKKLDLTLNVIVYGVDGEEVERLVREGLERYIGEFSKGDE